MRSWKYIIVFLVFIITKPIWALTSISVSETPLNFKIAFIGDQGLGKNAEAVLKLIKSEGAQAILHLGDLDYENSPTAWEAQINKILGVNFPYFISAGNHDVEKWYGENGYQQYSKKRLERLSIRWDGDLGVKSSIRYKGIFFIFVSPGDLGADPDAYIKEQLAMDKSIWRICGWHRYTDFAQVGNKKDDIRFNVYEEARKGGAIIATAHDHSYGRTHLMSSFTNPSIATYLNTMNITKGQTFAFFSGLGGKSIHTQKIYGPWWAEIYTKNQGATYGALFGIFNMDGVPNRAMFYFKNINNEIIDCFDVISHVQNTTTETKK